MVTVACQLPKKNGRNCVFYDFDGTKLCRTDFSVKSQFSLTAVTRTWAILAVSTTLSGRGGMWGYVPLGLSMAMFARPRR